MEETYNIMETAMLADQDILDDDVLVATVQKAVVQFIQKAKFMYNVLIPSLDYEHGVISVQTDQYLNNIETDPFSICIKVVPINTFISDKAKDKILNWLEMGAVGKSFLLSNQKVQIQKADIYNENFICLSLLKINDTEE